MSMKIVEIITDEAVTEAAKLNRHAREHAAAMIDFLRSQGVNDSHVEWGSKHPRLMFSFMGRPLYYSFPATPGDSRRASRMAVSDLRRLLAKIASNPTAALHLRRVA